MHITAFGLFHTLISVIAVAAAITSLSRYHVISSAPVGRTYLYMTILTCLTGFFIFHHGGFGKPHVLGIISLVVIAVAWTAEARWPHERCRPVCGDPRLFVDRVLSRDSGVHGIRDAVAVGASAGRKS